MRWIGLDLGTTNLKAVLYDDVGKRPIARASRPTPVREDADGTAHDADDIVSQSIALLAELTSSAPKGPAPTALAIAGLGEEVVLLDESGRAVAPVLVWFDPRGREEAAVFALEATPELHRRFRADPTFSLFKLMWIRTHRPQEWTKTAAIVDLTGYVLARLGGKRVMDWSHASRTALFDPVAVAWDRDVLDAAELAAELLPDLAPSGMCVGRLDPEIARTVGLPAEPPLALATGGHDHLCSAYASDVRQAGEIYLSAGTSEAQLILTDEPLSANTSSVDQGRFVDQGHFYVHANVQAGWAYGHWQGVLYGSDAGAMTAEVRSVPPGSRGVRFNLGRVGDSASLDGLTPSSGRAELMRAVLEGSAIASARITATVTGSVSAPAAPDAAYGPGSRIVVSGRAVHDPLWLQLRAGVTGRTLDMVEEPEAAALGAALLAQKAVTDRSDAGILPRSTYAPTPEDLAVGAQLRALYGLEHSRQETRR